jgi:branched-chain amino acid transport system substrate-binding protein
MFRQKNAVRIGLLLVLVLVIGLGACAPAATPTPTPKPPEVKPTAVPPTAVPTAVPTTPPQAIKIGCSFPLTGASAELGLASLNGQKLAVMIINGDYPDLAPLPLAAGAGLPNLGGALIEHVIADNKGVPETALSEEERMITQENIIASMGGFFSSCSATASEVAERYGIPILIGASTSPSLHVRGFKWFFRVGPHDKIFAENQLQFLAELRDTKGVEIKTLVLIHEDTLFGTDSASAQEALAAQYGFEVLAKIQYARSSPDLSSEILKAKSLNPDVIMPTSYSADAILLQKTMKDLDLNPKVILAQDSGYNLPQFLQTLGPDAEYVMSREVYSTDLNVKVPLLNKVGAMYKAEFGQDLFGDPAREFFAMIVMADAINRAGSTDPEAIRQALLATNMGPEQMMMPWAGVQFDPATGQNMKARGIMVQVQDNVYRTVWPFDVAQVEAKAPMPNWSER